ncbi:MAG: CHAT domain-containing protein, partial [Cyanobacteria bacterium J06642_11]
RDEQDRILDTGLELWTQIDNAYSAEFARALNVPMPMPPTLRTIQTTLQDISRTQKIKPSLIYVRVQDTSIELVLVTSEGLPVYRPVDVTATEMQAVINEFHQKIIDPILRPAQYLPPAQQLYDWLVRPLSNDLRRANIDHIGFILDTGLRSLPMAALHDGEHFLIENYSIGLMPSVGLTSMGLSQSLQPDKESVLAMGIADFVDQPDLEAVPLELQLATQKTGNDYYLNDEATLGALQKHLKENRHNTVHLATHATVTAGNSENSYVQLWDETVSFNQLQTLPLDAVEFLILSACATAIGDVNAEFGFAGLAVKVGVRTALASLWSISDEGTLGLMAEFYRALETVQPRSVALRQAQLAMLRGHVGIRNGTVYSNRDQTIGYLPSLAASGNWNFSHPAYWSGFTIIGNPW